MAGVFFHLLLWCLLGRSVRLAKSETNAQNKTNMTECFNTISNQSKCLTAWFSSSSNLPHKKTFKEASKWCQKQIISSSLIVIKNTDEQINFGRILRNLKLQNNTIFTAARKISNRTASNWTWVTGEPANLTEDIFKNSGLPKTACVKVIKEGAGQRLEYCIANASELHLFICQRSDAQSGGQKYVFEEGGNFKKATWYDARRMCIESEGDLASKLDLASSNSINGLQSNTKYWIGLHRNEWIWNSTGGEVTYTYWEGGFPDEDDRNQCICLKINEANLSEDPKWWSCNCNNSYPVICQTANASKSMATSTVNVKDQTNAFTIPNKPSKRRSTSASTTSRTRDQSTILSSNQNENTSPVTSVKTTTKVLISITAGSSTTNQEEKGSSATSKMTTEEYYKTKTFIVIPILIIVFVLVIIVAVIIIIIIIKKRRHRKYESGKEASSAYGTIVSGHRPPAEGAAGTGTTIYADVELASKQPPTSNNVVYASVTSPSNDVTVTDVTSKQLPINSTVYASVTSAGNDVTTLDVTPKQPSTNNAVYASVTPLTDDVIVLGKNVIYADLNLN